jgi:hypothetical protein
MSGCYGNDPEDRARERELNRYLEDRFGSDEPKREDYEDAMEMRAEERREQAMAKTSMCWNCNHSYPVGTDKCPQCGATNANVDFYTAQQEMLRAA